MVMNTNTRRPEVGTRVFTADDELLGYVSAVSGDCFKVDKPMAPDAWLGYDLVSSVDKDVRLSVTRNGLEGKPEGIEHLGFHVHRST
jgi:hypothetical protein